MTTTELHQAFFWVCDNCGSDNFCRAVTVSRESMENDPDLKDELLAIETLQGEAAWELGFRVDCDFTTTPEVVTCSHCGHEYGVDTE